MDESIVTYFGKLGAKHYIHRKRIKFEYKLWVTGSPLGYCIQFRPYSGKDSPLNKYGDPEFDTAVVAHSTKSLPPFNESGSIYHLTIDSVFTFPGLFRYFREKSIAVNETLRSCQM